MCAGLSLHHRMLTSGAVSAHMINLCYRCVCVLVRLFFPRYLTDSHCKNLYSGFHKQASYKMGAFSFVQFLPSLKIISLNKIRHQNENDI